MANKNLKDYQITAKVLVDVDLTIKAASLEDALAQSADLTIHDFVKIKGEYLDGGIEEIIGIYKIPE